MAIQDIVGNQLQPGAEGQVLGYTEPTASEELLTLQMYDFLIRPIRHADEQQGALFLKRYLEGPQEIWRVTQEKAHSVKKLWDITSVDDAFLPYLKRIVGWTPDLDKITEALDNDTLRKLISASVPLWKTRGPEDTMINVLKLATGANARIWNWFDLRWILEETGLEEQRAGRDSWMISSPGIDGGEYTSSLRIVDNGSLDRELVINLIKLMRAIGERIEVSFISFMDLFTYDGDTARWDIGAGDQMVVSGGMGQFLNSAQRQSSYVNDVNAAGWGDLVAYARIRGTSGSSGATFGMAFHYQDEDNYYCVKLDTFDRKITLSKFVAGVETVITSTDVNPDWPNLVLDGIYNGLRVEVIDNQVDWLAIKVYCDAQLVINDGDGDRSFPAGTLALYHDPDVSGVDFDEVELFELPLDTVLVDINT